MSEDRLVLGRAFGIAVCEYLGLDSNKVTRVSLVSETDEALAVEITHSINKADLQAIVDGINEGRLPVERDDKPQIIHRCIHAGPDSHYETR